MGIHLSLKAFQKGSRCAIAPVVFPISMYDKHLLKFSWDLLADKQLEFGIGLFYRLFKLRPDFIPKFTEFRDLNDVDQLLTWQELKGHPKKLSFAFGLAINSLNDGDVFIAKIESLGTKHLEKLETEDMKIMGIAIIETIKDLLPPEDCTEDVIRAWQRLYEYICKLFHDSIEKARCQIVDSVKSVELI